MTYRRRLILYMGMLVMFLVSVLALSYWQAREAVLAAASRNAEQFSGEVEGKLKLQMQDLRQNARLMAGDAELRRHVYAIVRRGAGSPTLQSYFKKEFGWLTFDRAHIISPAGKFIHGGPDEALVAAVAWQRIDINSAETVFYYGDQGRLLMAAAAPLKHGKRMLGILVLISDADNHLLNAARDAGYGEIFVVREGRLLRAARSLVGQDHQFEIRGNRVALGGNYYNVHRIALANASADAPQLWFGYADDKLMDSLTLIRTEMMLVAFIGGIIILITGMMVIRNFSEPLTRIVDIINDLSEGRFPKTRPAKNTDEFAYLQNQFHAMVNQLRRKQREVESVQAKLEEQATTDALTGLYNRRYLYELYPKLLADAKRNKTMLTVILIDLDHFKKINDKYGHVVGDQVLKFAANILNDCLRVSDFVFRIGGEEFLILTTGGIAGGEILAEKMRQTMTAKPYVDGKMHIKLSASFGVADAAYSEEDSSLSAVLMRADHALYSAKRAGRNRVATADRSIHAVD